MISKGYWNDGLEVAIFAVQIFITFFSGGSYGYDSILQFTLWVIWVLFGYEVLGLTLGALGVVAAIVFHVLAIDPTRT